MVKYYGLCDLMIFPPSTATPSHIAIISSIVFLSFLFNSYYNQAVENSVSETSLFREEIGSVIIDTETKEKL